MEYGEAAEQLSIGVDSLVQTVVRDRGLGTETPGKPPSLSSETTHPLDRATPDRLLLDASFGWAPLRCLTRVHTVEREGDVQVHDTSVTEQLRPQVVVLR
jgi:hypothetical protein